MHLLLFYFPLVLSPPFYFFPCSKMKLTDFLPSLARSQMNKQQIMTLLRSLDPQRLGSVKMTQVLKKLMR